MPVRLGKAVVTISAKDKPVGTVEFRVKDLPDPTARINGQSGGQIDTVSLIRAGKLTVGIYNSEFQLSWTVLEFTMSCSLDGFTYEKYSKGEKLDIEMINLIKKLKPGLKVSFEDIKVKGPEGSPRTIDPIIFVIK